MVKTKTSPRRIKSLKSTKRIRLPKISPPKRFCLQEMPIVEVKRTEELESFSPHKKLKNKELIVRALLECFENNDPDGVIDILSIYFEGANKSEFADKANIPRRTLYDLLHGSRNPTLRVLMKCIQECLINE